jgi:hypothetical protein
VDAEVELVAIARRQISLRELSRLRVGDIIPIESATSVQLQVEQLLLPGRLGVHGRGHAIKVTQVHAARAILTSNHHGDAMNNPSFRGPCRVRPADRRRGFGHGTDLNLDASQLGVQCWKSARIPIRNCRSSTRLVVN